MTKVHKMTKSEGVLSKAEATRLRDAILEDFRGAEQRIVDAAIKLDRFIRGRGWEPLGYSGMTEWREKEMNFEQFYNLRHAQRLLAAGIPAEKIERMKLSNIQLMVRQLPEGAWRQERWLKAAADMPVNDFRAHVQAEAESLGTVQEEVQRRGFVGPLSLVEKWDLALRVAEAVDGCRRMEARVEAIVATYLNSASETPGKSKMQSYEQLEKLESAKGGTA